MTTVDFDASRARTYRPSEVPKRARIVAAAPGERTTIHAEWGAEEHFVGPWVAVLDEGGATRYGVVHDDFLATHEPVSGSVELWRKTSTVDAYRHTGPSGIVTTVVADGHVETVNPIEDGQWLVRQQGGSVHVVTDAEFRVRYDVDHPLGAATD